ncbi:MAG: hypothetical protein KGQ26_08655 [Rhodospirillales bacterium]|nr:hypothetical protein [Rhodospirillales bacterium]
MYWPDQHQLTLWEPQPNLGAIVASRDPLDLKRDVVDNYDEVGTSTYLVTWGWVDNVVADCHKFGNRYTIVKTQGHWISIKSSPLFADITTQLQKLVNEQASRKVNHFCVIGQNAGSFLSAYVYWPEKNQLIFWLPAPNELSVLEYLDNTYAVDLRTGLIDGVAPFAGRMQRSYSQNILRACKASGQDFTITKSGK